MLSLTWGVSKGIKREGFCLRIQLPWVYKPLALKGFSMGGETRGIESPHATHGKQFQQSGESENLNDRHSQLIDGCFMRICESSQIRAVWFTNKRLNIQTRIYKYLYIHTIDDK